MMRLISRILAVGTVAARRLWAHRALSLATAGGLLVVAVFALCVPLYSDAVYHRVLNRELGAVRDDGPRLPPFAFVFRNGVYWQQRDPWTDMQRADYFVDRQLPGLLRLPRQGLIRYLQTTPLNVDPASKAAYGELDKPLLKVPLTAVSAFSDHVTLVEGELPEEFGQPTRLLTETAGVEASSTTTTTSTSTSTTEGEKPIKALISQPLAEELGVQLGDRFLARSDRGISAPFTIPVEIAGVWAPRDRTEPYWFYKPYEMKRMLMVSEQDFAQRVAPQLGRQFGNVLWYADFDGSGVRAQDVPGLIARIEDVVARGKTPDLNSSVLVSPLPALDRYQRDSQALTAQLYVFSIPLFVLAFAFIILAAGLSANDQRGEIAIMRSRGASVWQATGIAFIQSLLLGLLALAASVPAAMLVVGIFGQTRSFLHFTGEEALPVLVTTAGLPIGLAVMGAAIAIMVLPVAGAAGNTIVTYKSERARTLKSPWWQRLGLDFLLLIPAVYWTYLLTQSGTLDIFAAGATGDGPFRNPTLFLLPALALLALALLFVRCLPLVLRVIAWGLGRLPGAAFVLAARQLARSPGLYATPVLLLVLTLALAAFTASVAATLDLHLDQQKQYDVGADVRLVQTGQAAKTTGDDWFNPIPGSGEDGSAAPAGPRWTFQPITEYRKAEGVEAATRVGDYEMITRFSIGGDVGGRFVGVDRPDYPDVAFWRADFAAAPLTGLMNALGATPDGILIPEKAMRDNGLQVGDQLPVTVKFPDIDAEVKLPLTVVGSFKLWPTWYPNKSGGGLVFVGNLDYLFENAGGQLPYDVWIKSRTGADPEDVIAQVRKIDRGDWKYRDVPSLILAEQVRPERQGLFGMLSIGFLASAALTTFGFFLYVVFSLRRRFIELGVLRALGLDQRQMGLLLAYELALLLGLGLIAGTALGVGASQLYIPYLQATAASDTRAVPFITVVDWPRIYLIYGLFAFLFAAAMLVLAAFVRRLRIFQAIKLGETT